MPNKSLWAVSLMGCFLVTANVWADDGAAAPREKSSRDYVSMVERFTPPPDDAVSWDVYMSDGSYGGRMGRIPADTKVSKYTIDEYGQQQEVEAFSDLRTTTEIYSNTNSLEALPGGAVVGEVWHRDDGRVADDMRTQAVTPCELGEVRVSVHGGNLDPEADFERYSVTLQLWKCCPNQCEITLPPGQTAALTEPITFTNLKDNELSVLSIPIPAGTIPPQTTIWISAIFPNNDIPGDPLHVGAGFIVGSPPEKGFSNDAVDTPLFKCAAKFGQGWPIFPHASVDAKVFAQGVCETNYFAYLAVNNSLEEFDRGKNVRIADDVTLSVNDCELSSYEIGVIGSARAFKLTADLRTGPFDGLFPQPLNKIPGTDGVYLGKGLGDTEIARFTFPPGIAVPQEVWVTWIINQRNTGAILTQEAQIGSSSDLYAFETGIKRCSGNHDPCVNDPDCPGGQICTSWTAETFPSEKTGIFYIAVNCRGESPLGACCRVPKASTPPGGVCANEVTAAGCPQGRWLRNEACADSGMGIPDPFNPPCGTAACCYENSDGTSNCGNLTKSQCDTQRDCQHSQCVNEPGIWQPPSFCEDDDFGCVAFACYYADEHSSCLIEHPQAQEGGCETNDDCDPINGWYWGCDWEGQCRNSGAACHIDQQDPIGCHPSSDCDATCTGPGTCPEAGQVCKGTCSVSNTTCTSNSGCPTGETCVFGYCETPCSRPEDCPLPGQVCVRACSISKTPCEVTDDCPVGESCNYNHCNPEDCCDSNFVIGRCAYPLGCNDLRCCDRVCREIPQLGCCSPGSGWEFQCTEYAQNNCSVLPTNDECFLNSSKKSQVIPLTGGPDVYTAIISVNNMSLASWNFNPLRDPEICCNNAGINAAAAASEWFQVGAQSTPTGSSMWISTCESDGATGQDTILQVLTPTETGSEQVQCDHLKTLACNDDADCGTGGRMSGVCIPSTNLNQPIYIQLSTPNLGAQQLDYKLRIRQPCPTGNLEPTYTTCSAAKIVPVGSSEVAFECPAPATGICLNNTTLTCEGLDPDIECFNAMKNDAWIAYTPSCTGVLSINSCEPTPVPSPDTTLAVYGAHSNSPPCPSEGALLLDCNDDAYVNAEQHALRDQQCSLGRNECETDDDCFLIDETCENNQCVTSCGGPGTCPHASQVCVKACSISGDPCTISAECPTGETCGYDHCTRPCDTDADCTLATCTRGKNLCADDNDCDVGLCSWDHATVCDASITYQPCPDVCRDSPQFVCDRFAQPGQPGSCQPGDLCIQQACIRNESCAGEQCESECWPGSTVEAPVSNLRSYRVRLGGEFGSEPEGSLKFACEPGDCDFNGIPDVCEISCNAMDGACKQWDFIGCGLQTECHSAHKRCTVGGVYSPTGTTCSTNANCVAPETCSSGFSTTDSRYGAMDFCDIEFGRSDDCNHNGMPDECEIRDNPALDTVPPGGNGVLDTCESFCPDGAMVFTEMTSPGTDAGEPYPIDDQATPEGYATIFATGPAAADDLSCWSLVETDPGTTGSCSNSITGVVENPAGSGLYEISLAHPLQAQAITTITYTRGGGTLDNGVFTALAGDVDASGTTDSADINALIGCLAAPGTCDLWQCDIDRLGFCTAADLERLIDGLNAAGDFATWNGVSRAVAACP